MLAVAMEQWMLVIQKPLMEQLTLNSINQQEIRFNIHLETI